MQENHSYYLTEPAGKHFDDDFNPELTPKEMLELGVFSGKYLDTDSNEYPKSWFVDAKLSSQKNHKLNYFSVDASQSLEYWQQKGWINKQDPQGWFQWYCRYYLGRRSMDDERQIKRWKGMKRHIAQLKKNCLNGDLSCRPKQRQALLHWAYDSRKM
jgi:hypothetical protein